MSPEWRMAAAWRARLERTGASPCRARERLIRFRSSLRGGVDDATAIPGWVAATAKIADARTRSRVSMPCQSALAHGPGIVRTAILGHRWRADGIPGMS